MFAVFAYEKLPGLGRVVDAVGQLDWTNIIQILIEQIEIVNFKVLEVVLSLHPLQ